MKYQSEVARVVASVFHLPDLTNESRKMETIPRLHAGWAHRGRLHTDEIDIDKRIHVEHLHCFNGTLQS